MNTPPDSTRDALSAAILAHPDEDAPRLVYADNETTASALLTLRHLENLDVLKVMKGTAGRGAVARLKRRFGSRITIHAKNAKCKV